MKNVVLNLHDISTNIKPINESVLCVIKVELFIVIIINTNNQSIKISPFTISTVEVAVAKFSLKWKPHGKIPLKI